MRPFVDFDPGAARKLVGVIFDVDDTLTRAGRLEEEAYSALWRLHRDGLALVAVTGRPLGFAELMARMWPVELAVGENGAGWIRCTDHQLVTGHWDDTPTRLAQTQRLQALTASVRAELDWVQLADDQWARRCDVAFDVGERCQVPAEARRQLRACIERLGARTFESSVHVHAVLGDYDKGTGTARALSQGMGLDASAERERWLFVGDSGNDAAAFAYFPQSVGVANVVEHLDRLPVPPCYVTQSDRGRGFAELTDLLLTQRRG